MSTEEQIKALAEFLEVEPEEEVLVVLLEFELELLVDFLELELELLLEEDFFDELDDFRAELTFRLLLLEREERFLANAVGDKAKQVIPKATNCFFIYFKASIIYYLK